MAPLLSPIRSVPFPLLSSCLPPSGFLLHSLLANQSCNSLAYYLQQRYRSPTLDQLINLHDASTTCAFDSKPFSSLVFIRDRFFVGPCLVCTLRRHFTTSLNSSLQIDILSRRALSSSDTSVCICHRFSVVEPTPGFPTSS